MAKKKYIARDINLLPEEYREKEKYSFPRLFLTIFIILLLAASAYLYAYLENKIFARENQITNLEIQLESIEKIIQEVKNLEKDRELLANRVKVVESLITTQSRLTRVLGDFGGTILPEVWLNNLSLSSNNTFSFTADTFNNYLIARYMNTLKDSERFDAIELQYIRKQNTKIPELDKNIETVNFQLSGIFIPYRPDYEGKIQENK